MKNLWLGSSRNSIRLPFGDLPEKIRPFFSKISKYLLFTSYLWRWRSSIFSWLYRLKILLPLVRIAG